MAASVSFRGFAGMIGIDRDRVQMDGLLSAGLEAGADLLIRTHGEHFPIDTRLGLSNGAVQVDLSDESGRIDINMAPASVLAALFGVVGAPNAEELARAVVTWRDRHRSKGSSSGSIESEEVGEAASVPGPVSRTVRTNRRPGSGMPAPVFDDINQLGQVLDIQPDVIDRLEPLTTVLGGEAVNPLTASSDVLRVLPGMTAARLERLLELRRFPPVDPSRLQDVLGPAASFTKVTDRSITRVELTAALGDGYAAAATAIIVVLPKDTQPYRILAWTPRVATGQW
jgi:general secretion pathway protein K